MILSEVGAWLQLVSSFSGSRGVGTGAIFAVGWWQSVGSDGFMGVVGALYVPKGTCVFFVVCSELGAVRCMERVDGCGPRMDSCVAW